MLLFLTKKRKERKRKIQMKFLPELRRKSTTVFLPWSAGFLGCNVSGPRARRASAGLAEHFPVLSTSMKKVQQGPRIGPDECRHWALG